MKLPRRRAKRKGYEQGWWFSLYGDALHRNPGWTWYITPWLAFEPWNTSTLASLPDFARVETLSIEVGWLWWRARFTIGYTTRLDTPKKTAQTDSV